MYRRASYRYDFAEMGDLRDEINAYRPHSRHEGKTPNEVYFGLPAANSEPRIEPRPRARDHTPCARPRTLIDTRAGANVRIEVSFYKGRRHLPIIRVVRV